ncbi:SGNH/GDSL hydrolase family protein [Tessaracoccus sp. ZS01]|uniref:SGNH/GDSL hydrolase family protein n=1 Tax=Tessaracoccus sp. ZS01 TaxID=1906324 RepID=UPI00096D24F1|nr:SGNH/GDSL hydrolase family protein [Tessaracoccus sp. ZS01]MCG6568060.1 SGNH/GDSL hydrolase family protein [Tessaracoccus sp. ZS01]OMG54140.1 hypothetical protein BJN44_10595 [Tessaracoccus sp. ZS01]
MRTPRDFGRLSIIGLIVLGVLAVVLAAAALLMNRPIEAEPTPSGSSAAAVTPTSDPVAESSSPSVVVSESATPSPTADVSESVPPAVVETSPEPNVSESPAVGGSTVVVIGDSHSIGDDTWVTTAAEALGWGEVVNLSSPGRGYITAPRECDFSPCANFAKSVDLVVDAQPDLVVTFGGVADGDYSITPGADAYYAALRKALPDAEIVGISPVTTEDVAEYWLTLHGRSISAALDAVDGVFVSAGQPGLGDGTSLSAEAQDAIAAAVVEALS